LELALVPPHSIVWMVLALVFRNGLQYQEAFGLLAQPRPQYRGQALRIPLNRRPLPFSSPATRPGFASEKKAAGTDGTRPREDGGAAGALPLALRGCSRQQVPSLSLSMAAAAGEFPLEIPHGHGCRGPPAMAGVELPTWSALLASSRSPVRSPCCRSSPVRIGDSVPQHLPTSASRHLMARPLPAGQAP
jgi:hypothetical protein